MPSWHSQRPVLESHSPRFAQTALSSLPVVAVPTVQAPPVPRPPSTGMEPAPCTSLRQRRVFWSPELWAPEKVMRNTLAQSPTAQAVQVSAQASSVAALTYAPPFLQVPAASVTVTRSHNHNSNQVHNRHHSHKRSYNHNRNQVRNRHHSRSSSQSSKRIILTPVIWSSLWHRRWLRFQRAAGTQLWQRTVRKSQTQSPGKNGFRIFGNNDYGAILHISRS